MIKEGDQVIITKVDRDDVRAGLKGDAVCILVKFIGKSMAQVSPVASPNKRITVCTDQYRKF